MHSFTIQIIHSIFKSFIHYSIHSFTILFVHYSIQSLFYSFTIHSFSILFIHSLFYSFIRSLLTYLFIYSCLFSDRLIPSWNCFKYKHIGHFNFIQYKFLSEVLCQTYVHTYRRKLYHHDNNMNSWINLAI